MVQCSSREVPGGQDSLVPLDFNSFKLATLQAEMMHAPSDLGLYQLDLFVPHPDDSPMTHPLRFWLTRGH